MYRTRVFIAEKPSLAGVIAQGLGGGSKKDGFYDCGDDVVTWCFEHLSALVHMADIIDIYRLLIPQPPELLQKPGFTDLPCSPKNQRLA